MELKVASKLFCTGITFAVEAIKQKNRNLRQRKFKVVNLSIAYSVSIVK